MLYTTALVISFLFAVLEFRGIRENTSRLLLWISSGMVFVLVAFNRMNPDYNGYAGSFANGNANLELGYRGLNWLLKAMGLPFETILLLMGLLLWFALIKLVLPTSFGNGLVFYYLLFPLALDLPQIRNTLMYLIVILVVLIWADRNRFITLLCIIASSLLHILGLLYVPFAFLQKIDRKMFYRWIAILFALLSVGAIGLRVVSHLTILNNEISEELDPFEWFYFAIQAMQISIDLFTFWWIDRKIKGKLASAVSGKMEVMYRFGWYSALYLPLVSLSTEMYRFRRNAQLIKYAYAAWAMKYLSLKERLILTGLILLNLIFVIGMFFRTGDLQIYTYFDNNTIITWLKGLLPA